MTSMTEPPLADVPPVAEMPTSDVPAPDAPTTDVVSVEPTSSEVEHVAEEEALLEGVVAPPAAQLPALIEALLFVADGPVEEALLARTLGVPRRQIDAPLVALAEALRGRGLRLQRGPDGVQLVTAPHASSYVEQFLGIEAGRRLSTAALETLAIIAYRQPVTRGTLEAIRGVSSDGALDTLRARGLVDAAGRAYTPGRPTLFATTQKFLEYFGLERPEDLPELPDEVAALTASLPERAAQLPLEAAGVAPPSPDEPARVSVAQAGTVVPQQVAEDAEPVQTPALTRHDPLRGPAPFALSAGPMPMPVHPFAGQSLGGPPRRF